VNESDENPGRSSSNKRYISILATKDSKDWVDAIMKGSHQMGCSLPNLKKGYQSRAKKIGKNQLDE
jgi:hypothetical protein